ncbi:hypothetical protein J6590_001379 [Homalodisca vitripennis]|nr:hypothetical protein J6590_001379 [Homalodisca vitripennis]
MQRGSRAVTEACVDSHCDLSPANGSSLRPYFHKPPLPRLRPRSADDEQKPPLEIVIIENYSEPNSQNFTAGSRNNRLLTRMI